MTNREISPIGIYIHIPFCQSKCYYCDFLSAPANEQKKEEYVKALIKEIKNHTINTKQYLVETIYIGGGTPSTISVKNIDMILETLACVWKISPKAELTIEVNPGTFWESKSKEDKLLAYKKMGINRLSIGLQSFVDKELKQIGRIHTSKEFIKNYQKAREVGFENINVDLMFGLPSQTLSSYEYSLNKLLALQPEHISSYSLIIEEGTRFYQDAQMKSFLNQLPEEEIERTMYEKTKKMLSQAGYDRYEISNYAKKGYESRHNNSYWIGTQYIGYGLGASSYLEENSLKIRYHNENQLEQYLALSDSKQLRREVQYLSRAEEIEEFMFLGLRRMKGISKYQFKEKFNCEIESLYKEKIQGWKNLKLIEEKNGYLYLTDYGIDVSNQIFMECLLS